VQYFAVFIRFSGDCIYDTPRVSYNYSYGNQQEIGVSEGNEKGQGIKIPGIARIHPWQGDSGSQAVIQIAVQKPLYNLTIIGYYQTTWSLSTLDDRSIPTRLHCYRTCYSKVIMKNMHCLTPKVLVTRTVQQSLALSDNF